MLCSFAYVAGGSLHLDSIGEGRIYVISAVLDGHDAAATPAGDDGDRLTAIASKREKEGLEFLVAGVNALYGINFSFLCIT